SSLKGNSGHRGAPRPFARSRQCGTDRTFCPWHAARRLLLFLAAVFGWEPHFDCPGNLTPRQITVLADAAMVGGRVPRALACASSYRPGGRKVIFWEVDPGAFRRVTR